MNRYLSILRCRSYCDWPEWRRISGHPYKVRIVTSTMDVEVPVTMMIATYESRPRPQNKPIRVESKGVSPIVWRGGSNIGFWMGGKIYKDPTEDIWLKLEHERAYQGEIDVQIGVSSPLALPITELFELLYPLSHSVVGAINTSLGDFLVPVAPLQIREIFEDGSTRFQNQPTVAVRQRLFLNEEEVCEVLESVVDFRCSHSPEENGLLDTALRRYLAALAEEDIVDRYCDLWEACEFLVKKVESKGDIVSRIATKLSAHTGYKKPALENRLAIRGLYQIRKDLVHNAIEDREQLKDRLDRLEDLTLELIRHTLGTPYRGNRWIDERMQE